MNDDIPSILLLLECTLINEENPSYIEISEQNNVIYILLSKPDYKHYKLHERIQGVFGLLSFEHDDIMSKYQVIVECMTEEELDSMFKMYGDQE